MMAASCPKPTCTPVGSKSQTAPVPHNRGVRPMDFLERIRDLSARIEKFKNDIKTEEAAKQSFVIPFISALGFDERNPVEVEPEFTADVGNKSGEKVDYAIKRNGQPIILIECKKPGINLDDKANLDQLMRYFGVTNARVAILTNGILYRFFTDLEITNRMDQKPFLAFSLLDIQDDLIAELMRFCKDKFDINEIVPAAAELKYTREIKLILAEQVRAPTEDFVRFFATQVYSGKLTAKVMAQFHDVTKRATRQFINDQIAERLKAAMDKEAQDAPSQQKPVAPTGKLEKAEGGGAEQKRVASGNMPNKITVKSLLDAGLIVAGAKLEIKNSGQTMMAAVEENGNIIFNGTSYKNPSAAGKAAMPLRKGVGGWVEWKVICANGERKPLAEFREILRSRV